MITPQSIKRLGTDGLEIVWNNGEVQKITSLVLRQNCPSADSRAERGDDSHQQPLTAKKSSLRVVKNTKEEQLQLEQIWGVGNYAIGIRWADGHDTGIYPFTLLYRLGKDAQ